MVLHADALLPTGAFQNQLRRMSTMVRSGAACVERGASSRLATEGVKLAGDPEIEAEQQRRQSGVPVDGVVATMLADLATKFGVPLPHCKTASKTRAKL